MIEKAKVISQRLRLNQRLTHDGYRFNNKDAADSIDTLIAEVERLIKACDKAAQAELDLLPSITRKDALLRQALEALERTSGYMKCTEAVFSQGRMYLDMTLMPTLSKQSDAAITAIKGELND